jgi:hypothetical protein
MSVRVQDVLRHNIAPFEVAKAVTASLWKHSFVRDTFVRNRTAFERYQKSVIGDMAKLSIKSWLEENGFTVIDWDDVRTSWRSQRKDFDIQVNNHKIEIRSSISQHDNIRSLLRNEHIIHPCNVRVKEITIQAFFADKRCGELWICGWVLQKHLNSQNNRQVITVGSRLVDFFMLSFNHTRARPMQSLLRYLRR